MTCLPTAVPGACLLLLVGCSRPSAWPSPPITRDPAGSIADAPSDLDASTAIGAPGDAAPTEWMAACKERLDAALATAGKRAPALDGIAVARDVFVNGNGARVEVLTAHRLGFSANVTRTFPPDAGGDDAWTMSAESLNGGYHALHLRNGPKGSGLVACEGMPSATATDLASILRASIDRCLDAPGT